MKKETLRLIAKMQANEVAEHVVYSDLAERVKGPNSPILKKISEQELRHAEIWSKYTGFMPVCPLYKKLFYRFLAMTFGIIFVINLMETGEAKAQVNYRELADEVSESLAIYAEEQEHEKALIEMIDEERLRYISSMALGLNDALVELTGVLAGFTFALSNNRLIAMAGLITGSAATLSMAASEYVSKKHDESEKYPLKAAVYTGIAYMIAVLVLIAPYLLLSSPRAALRFCLAGVALLILVFTLFVSVVRRKPFRPAFLEMLGICFGVALISFFIGWAARVGFGVDI